MYFVVIVLGTDNSGPTTSSTTFKAWRLVNVIIVAILELINW